MPKHIISVHHLGYTYHELLNNHLRCAIGCGNDVCPGFCVLFSEKKIGGRVFDVKCQTSDVMKRTKEAKKIVLEADKER